MTNEQEKMVLKNQNLIYMVLKKYNLYSRVEEYFDLGMIGLCKGVKTYNSNTNIKLSTYLTKCISNEILGYFRKKRPNCISINSELNENLTFESVFKDDSIDIERDLIVKEDIKKLIETTKSLSKREYEVIGYLFNINGFEKKTQYEIASHFNISQAQVSRIKKNAFSKIRKKMESTGGKQCF